MRRGISSHPVECRKKDLVEITHLRGSAPKKRIILNWRTKMDGRLRTLGGANAQLLVSEGAAGNIYRRASDLLVYSCRKVPFGGGKGAVRRGNVLGGTRATWVGVR